MKHEIPFKHLIDKTNDVVIITDVKPLDKPYGPKIIYVNQAFVDLSGYTREEAIGKTPRILQGPKTDPETLKIIKKALIEEKSVRVEILNYAKDGTEYWLDFAVTPLYDHQGKLIYFAAIERDVSQYKKIQHEFYQLASIDSLTGLSNRRHFFIAAHDAFLRMQRDSIPLALLLIDLDDLKIINDHKGHLKGDEALCEVARACQTIGRKTDCIGRYGGDEFLILFHNITDEKLKEKTDSLYKKIQRASSNQLSVSIGGTLVSLQDESIDAAIKRADQALYQAKSQGKGRAVILNIEP